ncbi:MAG: signal peptidase I [Firmicutes bacterium]|nr:signal peptidase I [Bacillota bacterium]
MKNIIAFLCAALFGVCVGLGCGSAFAVTAVEDDAMAPALIKGERVLLDLFVTGEKNLKRGDVVELENLLYVETGEDGRMLKRIIAMPGERVSISDGFVWIDGTPLTGDAFEGIRTGNEVMSERLVPEGAYFVLGDNLTDSTDSRDVTVGMIREEDILGRVITEW